MNKIQKKLIAAVILGVLCASVVLAAQSKQWTKGHEAFQRGDYAQAIAIYNELSLHGKAVDRFYFYYWLGCAYETNGQYAEALTALGESLKYREAARDTTVNNILPHVHEEFGICHRETGAYAESIASYRKAIELDPTDAQLYTGLALTLVRANQSDEALAAAKKGLELKPNSYSNQVLGVVYMERRQYGEAAAAFRRAVDESPKYVRAYIKLAEALLAGDDLDGAIGAYAKGAELAPEDPGFPYWIGGIRARTGRFEEALAAFDKAVGLACVVGIGVRIKMEDGLPVIQRTVTGDPGIDHGPAKESGLKAGDAITAIQGWAAKGKSQDEVSRRLKGDANTQVALTVRRPGQAKPIERTLTRRPIFPKTAAPYLGERSLVCRELGLWERAAKDAEQAYALDPMNAQARVALAAARLDAGEFDAAIKLLSGPNQGAYARLLEAAANAGKGDTGKAAEVYAAIPEKDLGADWALRRSARKALLAALSDHVRLTLERARAADSEGRSAEALSGYAEALKAADEETAGLIRQSAAALIKKDPAAVELSEEARKRALRGDLLINEGRFAEALVEYSAAVKLAPFNPQLRFNTALINGQLKDYREAIRSMTVYLQLLPDAPNARAAKDEVYKWEFQLENAGKK